MRDIVFYNKDKKRASGNVWTVIFALMMVAVGIVTYQNYMSLFTEISSVIGMLRHDLKGERK